MFVVMALVTTFATTPLTSMLYPPWYQKKLASWKSGETDWDGNPINSEGASDGTRDTSLEKLQSTQVRKLLVYLRLDSLPSLFTFIDLLGGDKATVKTKIHRSRLDLEAVPEEGESSTEGSKRPLEVHGLRILELTERTSSVMKVSEGEYIPNLRTIEQCCRFWRGVRCPGGLLCRDLEQSGIRLFIGSRINSMERII